jgi:hypothetical protein
MAHLRALPGRQWFQLEPPGPSRWNTCRALRVLRWWGNEPKGQPELLDYTNVRSHIPRAWSVLRSQLSRSSMWPGNGQTAT